MIGHRTNTTSTLYNINSTVTTNGRRESGVDGTTLASFTMEGVDGALDTSVSGDTDSNGYYFGECNGNIVLLSTKLNPVGSNACTSTPVVDLEDYEENVFSPTHGGIVYLDPINPTRICTKDDVDLNKNSNGKLTGVKSGCMRFYVISEDLLTYKLLLDHNTSGNVSWTILSDYTESGGDASNWDTMHGSTDRGPVTANKQLAIDTQGWIGNPRLITANEVAEITGALSSLGWESSKTYTSPVTDMDTQIEHYYFDGNGNSYNGWLTQIANSTNKSDYSWLYNNTYECKQYGCRIEDNNEYSSAPSSNNPGTGQIHGYWTSDAKDTVYAWAVTEKGYMGSNYVSDTVNIGVRPVITVSKTTTIVH